MGLFKLLSITGLILLPRSNLSRFWFERRSEETEAGKSVRSRSIYAHTTGMQVEKYLYHVYIVTNRHHTVLYTGMTGWGFHRILQHIRKENPGFTQKYNLNKLVWFEEYGEVTAAIAREKQIKRWSRKKKEWLIELKNPEWKDLLMDHKKR
ncbi:GIY-YIG nuclease family protein [Rhodohalobacter sp. 8-1]|uniref:GIY-YIG nuclease family protein n=1 Tax=Rhodohalobacter sp. 8-1 TaxID=3131972 RepID=UPI0030EC09B8